jgi:hypothetical protein
MSIVGVNPWRRICGLGPIEVLLYKNYSEFELFTHGKYFMGPAPQILPRGPTPKIDTWHAW